MYWSIYKGYCIQMLEISVGEMNRLRQKSGTGLEAVPVYWCKGEGVWPKPQAGCFIVQEIDADTI